jgi:hypothetical protein
VSFLLLRATLLDPRFTIIMCGYFLCRRDGPLAVASSLSAPTACWDDAHVDAITMGPAPASKLESASLEPTDDAEESTLEPRVRVIGWGAPADKKKECAEHTQARSTPRRAQCGNAQADGESTPSLANEPAASTVLLRRRPRRGLFAFKLPAVSSAASSAVTRCHTASCWQYRATSDSSSHTHIRDAQGVSRPHTPPQPCGPPPRPTQMRPPPARQSRRRPVMLQDKIHETDLTTRFKQGAGHSTRCCWKPAHVPSNTRLASSTFLLTLSIAMPRGCRTDCSGAGGRPPVSSKPLHMSSRAYEEANHKKWQDLVSAQQSCTKGKSFQ